MQKFTHVELPTEEALQLKSRWLRFLFSGEDGELRTTAKPSLLIVTF